MKHSLMCAMWAATAAVIAGPVLAQVPPQTAALPPQPSPPAYSGRVYPSYPFALTPEDAYRDGSITRWEYERAAGPLPQALQGPPVDGNRGGDGGDRGG